MTELKVEAKINTTAEIISNLKKYLIDLTLVDVTLLTAEQRITRDFKNQKILFDNIDPILQELVKSRNSGNHDAVKQTMEALLNAYKKSSNNEYKDYKILSINSNKLIYNLFRSNNDISEKLSITVKQLVERCIKVVKLEDANKYLIQLETFYMDDYRSKFIKALDFITSVKFMLIVISISLASIAICLGTLPKTFNIGNLLDSLFNYISPYCSS